MTIFHVGDWVVAANPVNENWSDEIKGLVTHTFPELGRMHVRWYHPTVHGLLYGATNYSVDMTKYRKTTVER